MIPFHKLLLKVELYIDDTFDQDDGQLALGSSLRYFFVVNFRIIIRNAHFIIKIKLIFRHR